MPDRTWFRNHRSVGNTLVTQTKSIFPPRQGHVYRIRGYSMVIGTNQAPLVDTDNVRGVFSLQCRDDDWAVGLPDFYAENLAGDLSPVGAQTIFDAIALNVEMASLGQRSGTIGELIASLPYQPCDVVVPAMWGYFGARQDTTAIIFLAAVIDFEVIRATPAALAAVSLRWGRGSARPET